MGLSAGTNRPATGSWLARERHTALSSRTAMYGSSSIKRSSWLGDNPAAAELSRTTGCGRRVSA
jgi:hypothetical protein